MIEQSPFGRVVVPDAVPEGFALFYTTRDFEGRLGDGVAERVVGFIAERFGIDASLSTCVQVHGVAVAAALRGVWSECDSCDALYSAQHDTALGIKVADCLPVTMIDPLHSVIANIHSGWRGAVQRITAATLDTLARETSFDPHSARAWLGPTIRACCFEVGEEVAEQFDEKYVARGARREAQGVWSAPRAPRPAPDIKPHVDVAAFTTDILRERGFAADAIIDTKLCTRCDGSIFHSYRRDGKGGGRNLAIVAQ